MPNIESHIAKLLSANTDNHTLRFREWRTQRHDNEPPEKEWELPYSVDLDSIYSLLNSRVRYVTSDGTVIQVTKPD